MGSRLELVGLTKSFAEKPVLKGLDLALTDGEFVSLLGPSGCGKTTTLNLIAGFFAPEAGSIRLGSRDITALPPHRRGVSMVFQNYALFPHMTVEENIGFGLRMQRERTGIIAQRIAEMLQLVQLAGVGKRFPRELSGGQQQRVGLARAMAVRPGLLVLDEPMSNLDAKLRRQMQLELRQILQQVGTTTLYVTHDQEEALAMSDRVVVMNEGAIEQIGTPADVYHRPRTRFVAGFVGESNFIEGTVAARSERHAQVRVASDVSVSVADAPAALRVGDPVTLMVRPEHIKLAKGNGRTLPATIRAAAFSGADVRLRAEVEGLAIFTCEEASRAAAGIRVGQRVGLSIDEEGWIILPGRPG